MIVMLERGESLVIGNWGKGWEIQVQPVAVQSKPKKDAGCRKEMWEGRAFISLPLDPCQEFKSNFLPELHLSCLAIYGSTLSYDHEDRIQYHAATNMARLNEESPAPEAGPRLSLLPSETAEDAVVCSLDWLNEATKTPEGLEQAFSHITATIRERDHLLEKH
jgi:hypothetical protein